MEQFLFAVAYGAQPTALVRECLEQIGPVPATATLGFVYATDSVSQELSSVLEILHAAAPDVQWTGTVGNGICTSGREYYDDFALAVMITDIPRENYRLLPVIKQDHVELSPALRRWWGEQEFCFGLLHGDPTDVASPAIVDTLAHHFELSFFNGGFSSAGSLNYQILDHSLSKGGVSGVLFNQNVAVQTDHTQGCTPFGPQHTITEAQRNVLVTLDRRPALEVMKQDIGPELSKNLQKLGNYLFIGLPIQGTDTGDYLVRNLMGLDLQQGLIAVAEHVEGKHQLMFCRRDRLSAREDLMRMLKRLNKRINGQTIRGGIYINCTGRGRHQFGEDSEELKMIRAGLGDFPLLGFSANGEIYNGRLYGYTGVLTLFLQDDFLYA